MAKEFTSEILKTLGIFGEDEKQIFFGQIKWNGREPKGYDIRHYNKEEQKAYKGITIPYDAFEDLLNCAIESGCCDNDRIRESLNKSKKRVFSDSDFDDMFNRVKIENKKYKRDKYGVLRDDEGYQVILKRRR